MMSLELIHHMSDQAAVRAANEGREPYTPTPREVVEWTRFPFPFLGSYVPAGWRKCADRDELFCDSSGFGGPGEPALTVHGLKSVVLALLKADPTRGFDHTGRSVPSLRCLVRPRSFIPRRCST